MKTRRFSALVAASTAVAMAGRLQQRHQCRLGRRLQRLTLASVDQGSIEDVVKAFEAANPGVKVNFTTSGADQYQQQIRTQLASGTGTRRDVGVAGQRQPRRDLRPGQAGIPARPLRPAVGRQAAGRPQGRRAVPRQDVQRDLRASTASGRSTTSRRWTRPASPRRAPGRSCWPSAGPPPPRERPPSHWATRTTG